LLLILIKRLDLSRQSGKLNRSPYLGSWSFLTCKWSKWQSDLGAGVRNWLSNQPKCEMKIWFGSSLQAIACQPLYLGFRPIYLSRPCFLSSQAKKLFRSGLIVVGPNWMWPCIQHSRAALRGFGTLDFPAGSWHCWLAVKWISSELVKVDCCRDYFFIIATSTWWLWAFCNIFKHYQKQSFWKLYSQFPDFCALLNSIEMWLL